MKKMSQFNIGFSACSFVLEIFLVTLMVIYQTGDLRFDGRERIHYTRDQLLQLREVWKILYLLL